MYAEEPPDVQKAVWREAHYLDDGPNTVTQQAMSNQWLREQGLVSVRDLWVALNYSR